MEKETPQAQYVYCKSCISAIVKDEAIKCSHFPRAKINKSKMVACSYYKPKRK